jgi:excisionase family DNA binding protein
MQEKILTRKEAADFLRIKIRTLDYLVATRQIPFSRIGKKILRFRQSRLLQLMDERENIPFSRGESSEQTRED